MKINTQSPVFNELKKGLKVIVGIDPGTRTGFAVAIKATNKLVEVTDDPIHRVMNKLIALNAKYDVSVYVEDARKRKKFGVRSMSKQQGAGSIKRDCRILEDFLKDNGIKYKMIHPIKNGTKWDANRFKSVTGWQEQTNEHSRDAGVIAYLRS